MAIKIHYFSSEPPNFGDEINTFLWNKLMPNLSSTSFDGVLVGIGTILDDRIPIDSPIYIFGSGAGLAPLPRALHDARVHVLAVRGPLTAALCRLPPESAVTDPALFLRSLYPDLLQDPSARSAGKAVFVPHFSTAADPAWLRVCSLAGLEYIDPRDDCLSVVRRIASARLVVAEAMHGAIVADTFRVPWIPVASTPHFSAFKWVDWTLSLQVQFAPVFLPAISLRHQSQRLWLALSGDHSRLGSEEPRGICVEDAPEIARLLRETEERISRTQSRSGKWAYLKLASFYNRAIDPLMSRLGDGVLRQRNARFEERTAAVISRLVNSPGFLSDDEVSAARLQVLHDRLSLLRNHLIS